MGIKELKIVINLNPPFFMSETKKDNLISRPPVVVVLGHVDHGKSSILEAIRDLKITEKESGGITQHIGAYEVIEKDKKITFIDTPGHEAFSAMRSRGAKVADIAVLVVAADEGVKVQTKEAISHIKKANIPLIVAINKIDKPTADPQRIKRELAKEEILVESMGGKVPSVEVSAKTKQGIEDLLELILLVAEMESLKADTLKPAEGAVVEAYLDSLRGSTATLLLTNGILEPGQIVGTSSTFGKIKSLENFQGFPIKTAFPSMPVVVSGLEAVPRVGEEFKVFPGLELAKDFLQKSEKKAPVVLSVESNQKILNLILKADVLGSLEAVEEVLKDLSQEKANLKIMKAEVGEVNENDIKLTKNTGARILAFRVKINPVAQILAEREKIKIMQFEVIYELVEATRKLMEKIIEPEIVRLELGKIKILAVFLTEKNRQILGGKVIEGEAKKGFAVEVLRNDEKVGQGRIVNLQKNKKDAEKAAKGEECGLLYEGGTKAEEGDILAIFSQEKRKIEL